MTTECSVLNGSYILTPSPPPPPRFCESHHGKGARKNVRAGRGGGGRSAAKCPYSHELTAVVAVLQEIKPTRSVNIPPTALIGPEYITNNTGGQGGGRGSYVQFCLVGTWRIGMDMMKTCCLHV